MQVSLQWPTLVSQFLLNKSPHVFFEACLHSCKFTENICECGQSADKELMGLLKTQMRLIEINITRTAAFFSTHYRESKVLSPQQPHAHPDTLEV